MNINLCRGSITRKPGRGHISVSPPLRRKFAWAMVHLWCISHLYKHHSDAVVLLWDSSRGGEELTQKTETGRVDRSAVRVWIISTMLLHERKCSQTNRDIWEPPEDQRRNVGCIPKLSSVKGAITNPLCSRALTPHSNILLNGLHTAEAPVRNAQQ